MLTRWVQAAFVTGGFLLLAGVVALLGWILLREPSFYGPGSARSSLGIRNAESALFEQQVVGDEAVALLRARLAGQADPSTQALDSMEGRRVFLQVYRLGEDAISVHARADNLAASLQQAADMVIEKNGAKIDGEFRLRVGVAVEHVRRRFGGEIYRPPRAEVGAFGLWLEPKGGKAEDGRFFLGPEILEQRMWNNSRKIRGLPMKRIRKMLRSRGDDQPLGELRGYGELHTVDWTDSVSTGKALRLRRGYLEADHDLDADKLERRALHAADFLARSVDEEGKYVYVYLPMKDEPGRGYNLLRHAGSTWAMLQAYQRFGDPDHLAAARRAIDFFVEKCQLREEQGRWGEHYRFCIYEDYAKLGANGLGLLMLTEYMQATGDMQLLDTARELARFTRRMQEEDGHFLSYFDWGEGAKLPDEEVIFYPGEASFGLMQLYRLDPDPLWLETTKDGVDFMIHIRDKGKGERRIPHDHWLMYALSLLYKELPDEAYLKHGELIAGAVANKQYTADDSLVQELPEMLGGFHRPANFTSSGTRSEAMVAAIDLWNLAELDPAESSAVALRTLAFSTGAMFTPDSTYALPNPARAMGGIPDGHTGTTVRNDFVQHNLSGLLGMERHLRAADGVTLPGGPNWTGSARIPSPEDLVRWQGWRDEWGAGPTLIWPQQGSTPLPAP